jgi:hypothetical protein
MHVMTRLAFIKMVVAIATLVSFEVGSHSADPRAELAS